MVALDVSRELFQVRRSRVPNCKGEHVVQYICTVAIICILYLYVLEVPNPSIWFYHNASLFLHACPLFAIACLDIIAAQNAPV